MSSDQQLDELFSAPSLPPSQLSPQKLPGANLESLTALLDVLKDNHKRHHIFFNDLHFHNHVAHRALAIYALGGPAATIRDYYERDSHIQRTVIQSPEPITEENFVDHLADENFYQAYITFFAKQVSEKGAARTIEEFIFSEKYNFRQGRDTKAQPEMLARLFQGLVHSMIHIGYGAEFGLKGMLVEGLALATVHRLEVWESFPPSLFASKSTDIMEHLANRLSSSALIGSTTNNIPAVSRTGGTHTFDIVAHILKDDRLARRVPADFVDHYKEVLNEYYPMVRGHAEQWTVDPNQPGEIESKMEELTWLSSLLYGAGGLRYNGFQPDFFLMHMVTSSLFLPSLLAYLTPRSQVLLLRGYLITVLTWWVMRGRPALDIKSLMTTTSLEPPVPATPAPKLPVTTETTPIPNPFLIILQSAITHPNDHLVKIQRAFAHYDTLYGRRPVGYFKGTELAGAELLDGSMFLRAALLTMDYVGWVREGKEAREFSLKGFFA